MHTYKNEIPTTPHTILSLIQTSSIRAVSPLPRHDLRDGMPDGDARLFHLLLRQTGGETDLQGGLGGEDVVFGAGRVGGEGLVPGDQDALC